jgi:hypothetical protein
VFDLAEQPAELRASAERVARSAGVLPEAALLVFYATAVASRDLGDDWWVPATPRPFPADAPTRHLTAVELCDAASRCARARAGDDAARVFHLWGLKTGADVGRVVFALAGEGLIAVGPGDRPEPFDRVPLRRLLNPVRGGES